MGRILRPIAEETADELNALAQAYLSDIYGAIPDDIPVRYDPPMYSAIKKDNDRTSFYGGVTVRRSIAKRTATKRWARR